MNMTFHMTDACNLACKYCFQTRSPQFMTEETARKAIDLSVNGGEGILAKGDTAHTGICFFGGEPLLMRELIEKTVDYCSRINIDTGHKFQFKLVTNGTLLDEDFLRFAAKNKIGMGFSHDGLMQDDARVFPDGKGTARLLDEKIPLLLEFLPDTLAMCTINPSSAVKFADSVEWLFEKGFRRIYTIPAVGDKAIWTDEQMLILDDQYRRIAELYVEWTSRGEEFDFLAFDSKIAAHILGDAYKHRTCRFGQKQVSIAPDGSIYPCIQFVGEPQYRMGDVYSGVLSDKLSHVIAEGKNEPASCSCCALKNRCKFNCCCMNKHQTGVISQVSPFTCAHEQLLIKYADIAANELFRRKDGTFLKRQYRMRLEKMNPEFFLA